MKKEKERVLFVRLNKKDGAILDRALKKSGLRQCSEFIRMLLNDYANKRD